MFEKAENCSFAIKHDHPCLAGHFPSNPIVPAVVLLDELVCALKDVESDIELLGFSNVKFLQPVKAGQNITIHIDSNVKLTTSKIKFSLKHNAEVVALGDVRFKINSSEKS